MTSRMVRAIHALHWQSMLPESALTIVPWTSDGAVELRAWVDSAFLHSAPDLPRAIHGIPVRVFARSPGTPHIGGLRCATFPTRTRELEKGQSARDPRSEI
jgi:hypothetical protein